MQMWFMSFISKYIGTSSYMLPCLLITLLLCSCIGGQDGRDKFSEAEEAFSEGRINEAGRLYERFLDTDMRSPRRFEAWNRLLLIHLDIERDIERGLNILKTMSVEYEFEEEYQWSILIRIGRLYARMNRFEDSMEVLERSVRAAGNHDQLFDSYITMAELYYHMRDFVQVSEVVKDIKHLLPNLCSTRQGRINYLLGKTYYQLGETDMAIQYLNDTFYSESNEHQRSKAGILLFDIYLERGKTSEAELLIRDLEKIYPNPMVIKKRMETIQ